VNDEILARIDAEWQRFLPSLDGLTEEQASQPGVAGYYSVKDLIAHLAWWENQTREVVESGIDEPLDVEAINDQIYAEFRDTSFVELEQRMISGHERAVATFAATPNLTEDDVESDTWEHYQEHGDQIRAWRDANGI
jgi:uncharacterized protein (TIGR03083 family)